MAIPKFIVSKLLHHSRPIYSISSASTSQFHSYLYFFFRNPSPTPCSPFASSPVTSFFCRSFSTRDSHHGTLELETESADTTRSQSLSDSGFGVSEVGGSLGNTGSEDSILPVRALISLFDGYHDLTGFPWWIVIGSSTLALRVALLPPLILQITKLNRIAELFPKLPPPLPPPLSGRSYKDQFMLFWSERRAAGCPSFLWFMAYISVQFPCFLLWMTTIRRMSLDHHTGFDYGGILWFQNLTELPHGVLGSIFPLLIAGLHFVNVQISFQTTTVGKMTGLFSYLVKTYKFYLDTMTIPILFAGFCVPQGSLVYWLTNSSLTLIQQLCLKNPDVRLYLGLPDKEASVSAGDTHDIVAPKTSFESSRRQHKISVRDRSAHELVILSVQLLAKGHRDRAIILLRQALDKDPEHLRALIVMGQTLLQEGLLEEATEFLERAISKLFIMGHPTEVEEVDLLIVASQWAGSCYIRQGKFAKGMIHFERLGLIKEPEDARSKAHYFEGLVMLASALTNEGRKAEAAKYLRKAAAYDPAAKVYLEQLENEEDDFASDLVNSRRGDY